VVAAQLACCNVLVQSHFGASTRLAISPTSIDAPLANRYACVDANDYPINRVCSLSTDAPNSVSIPDLLARARSSDPRELEVLFAQCRNYLGIVARAQVESWLRAKVDASDLVQQTMLEAYRDFHKFRGQTEAEWLAWLRQILTHNAANFIRHYRGTAKRQAHREVSLSPGADSAAMPGNDPADSGESPSQQLMRKERDWQVADALAQLAPDHREVILLRNLERLSFDEVAQRMGRSRPAVQMLWMRAIQKLQEAVT
jgi:RNA polymerase sigma-70 factor, ECF subfamily